MRNLDDQYKLASYLGEWTPKASRGIPITDQFSLLKCLVEGSTPRGLWYADPALIWCLSVTLPRPSKEDIVRWRDDLVEWGDIAIKPLARDCFGGSVIDVTEILHKKRFHRWRGRSSIPRRTREAVYMRDSFRCVSCGSTEELSLDHIIPFSMGGPDTEDNLQTMCRSCNSSKGARYDGKNTWANSHFDMA